MQPAVVVRRDARVVLRHTKHSAFTRAIEEAPRIDEQGTAVRYLIEFPTVRTVSAWKIDP